MVGSKGFFPDDPAPRPQVTDCRRRAETTCRLSGMKVAKLCTKCARIWDETDFLWVGLLRGERIVKFADRKR